MHLHDYYRDVLVPANTAVASMRRNGLPIDVGRTQALIDAWDLRLKELEAYVEGEAAKRGMVIKYSESHGLHPATLVKFLFTAQGLGLEVKGYTEGGQPSTDDSMLAWYASLSNPRDDDHPIVRAILEIRALGKARSTHLLPFINLRRRTGCVHPTYNWTLRTARLSAEDPPVHQIPEKSYKVVAEAVKSCIVPRHTPPPSREEWDPRKHGSCFRWDISGAEAAIRAAMLTYLFCSTPDPAWEYVRLGKDLHGRTASLIYNKPEGTYKKGSQERELVGKQSFFAKQYGAEWFTLQATIWERARIWLPDQEAERISNVWDSGYPGLVELYERDKMQLGKHGYCQDGYGRRRWVGLPSGVTYRGVRNGKTQWEVRARTDDERKLKWRTLKHNFHVMANTPTQSMSASDALWMLALLYGGEYVTLQYPPMWADKPLPFPEAADWQMDEGEGPGGKPMLSWHNNTVHDSGWGDCAPGYLEPSVMLAWRRGRAVPFDWRLQADVPYRIDVSAGPDMGKLYPYADVAKRFGLTPLPD
jgi:hypothetical protein